MTAINKSWIGRPFWKNLSNLWGVVAMGLFVFDFFSFHSYNAITASVAIIYVGVLTIYVSSKEFYRWKSKDKFQSKYFGEAYIILWTVIMLCFAVIAFFYNELFKIPGEFIATYISALSIFAITQHSKNLKSKN
jgi:phosphatidylserine synthase